MKFFHLSHTDLDGYGCQMVTQKKFPDGFFYNANYGLEIKINIDIIIKEIEKLPNEEIFFLISDLNLSPDESKKIDRKINDFNNDGFNIKFKLLDHHGFGKKSADKYSWYFLDTSRCATKIVYDYFCENFEGFKLLCDDNFERLVDSINAVDIWLDDSEYFEFGKVCMSMVSKSHEINSMLFPKENREYRIALLLNSVKIIKENNSHILLDGMIHTYRKNYLKDGKDIDDTIDNLSSNYLLMLLENRKDNFTVNYKNHKGLLTFTLGNVSIPANAFLKSNDDYDFFIDVSRRGKSSIRADGKLDVSIVASKMANGGGHPNASGMAFNDWKETTDYDKVKIFVQNKLDNIID